ncbi:glycosyltransferase family 4 protein [Rubritalea tangerina]|uniref:Glycosyltransferase family 4 protein n=1 Tax=Rubritalea tangerina TaxID=430798 RepID=A0ABW4ZAC7_9BACT
MGKRRVEVMKGRRVLFVDRACADSIWTVVTPVSRLLLERGAQVLWVRMVAGETQGRVVPPAGVEEASVEVPRDGFPCAWIWQMCFFIPKFQKLLKTWRPDIVHTNFIVPGGVARLIGKQAACRVVSTQHEMYGSLNPLLRGLSRWSERYVDVMVYVSETVAKSYSSSVRVGDYGGSEEVIYNSVDVIGLRGIASAVLEKVPSTLSCVGRMVPEKGQRSLLEAWRFVVDKDASAVLHFYGSGPDEPLLQERVIELGLEKSVVFHGWVEKEEAVRGMARSTAVVQPSDGTQEGFGLSLVEAMSVNDNVVVSAIPVFHEVVGDLRDHVYFVNTHDVRAVADILVEVMLNPERCVADSHKVLAERYSERKNAESYIGVYDLI